MKKITLCLIFVSSLLFTACNKGDGEHFYLEIDADKQRLIYHSLSSCSEIETGVRRDEYHLDWRYCTTCPKCMDDDLIDKLHEKRKRR